MKNSNNMVRNGLFLSGMVGIEVSVSEMSIVTVSCFYFQNYKVSFFCFYHNY